MGRCAIWRISPYLLADVHNGKRHLERKVKKRKMEEPLVEDRTESVDMKVEGPFIPSLNARKERPTAETGK